MTKLASLLAAASFALSGAANAAIVSYDFSAKVDHLPNAVDGAVASMVAGKFISLGDQITGSFSFDDSALMAAIGNSAVTPDFGTTFESVSFTYHIPSIGFSLSTDNAGIRASRDGTKDWFDVLTSKGGMLSYVMMLDSWGSSGTDDKLRYAVTPSNFDRAFVQIMWLIPGGGGDQLGATLTRFDAVAGAPAEVPEPAGWALSALGLGLAVAARRRATHRQATAA